MGHDPVRRLPVHRNHDPGDEHQRQRGDRTSVLFPDLRDRLWLALAGIT